MTSDTIIHLIAGGSGGTAGAIVTCPLEVVKTRLQSSVATFQYQPKKNPTVVPFRIPQPCLSSPAQGTTAGTFSGSGTGPAAVSQPLKKVSNFKLIQCLRFIVETEGIRGLFKGLGPTVVGVAPSRAIYFSFYSHSKNFFNDYLPPNSPLVHIFSAGTAGISACTVTNPIWFVKTRLQLDQRKDGSLTARKCIAQIYQKSGIRGFYKGISASYFGVSETIIHWVIYEAIKSQILASHVRPGVLEDRSTKDFIRFMGAAACSKTIAATLAYPHEVARTRLRQEGDKYRSFWQTLSTVIREERFRGLYSGLTAHLIRQIPNTAVTMVVYESVVYLLTRSRIDADIEHEEDE
ncbi:Solute carrier family 25 member 36-A [Hypsibius exemplaris]|uniref:Solute carrier family 25 member 36-A n=1 Tax=Hypsibius exemplaris TaxID=2072580 RepID=A0A1W0WPK7_HYPEX|nr:Solute carrier family 25 member 36-A [Hypsibius exemplaris]